ncbi:unnamed protein product [Ostreobium quekettii]|uniref:Uncharacterized protein n=1 Tax=Ostreobium quekettii TaxID=121088 RepID=A0A8S1IQY6_9CHLO|nr:unnamed protein product [Ostreobium quekettii]|eukprot:evm.model.scf_74.15 EVM.evm.TU.scf_74.15   scf_74:136865-140640(-)
MASTSGKCLQGTQWCLGGASSGVFGRPVGVAHKQQRRRGAEHMVVFAKKGKKTMRMRGGPAQTRQLPPTPPIDPDNEEFVIFVRSKLLPRWYPYSIMKGGWSANALAKSQQNEWGKKLYSDTLVKNVGQALYKEIDQVERSVRKNYPPLKDAKELEYGFKIRDREQPEKWYVAEDVKLIPPAEEVKGLLDDLQEGFEGVTKGFQDAFNFGGKKK